MAVEEDIIPALHIAEPLRSTFCKLVKAPLVPFSLWTRYFAETRMWGLGWSSVYLLHNSVAKSVPLLNLEGFKKEPLFGGHSKYRSPGTSETGDNSQV